MKTPDVLVIGGGILGCTLARELARVFSQVIILERGRVGCGASSAAAGMLTPALTTAPAGALLDLCHDSAALYETWLEELQDEGAGDVGFTRKGLLDVWTDPARVEENRQLVLSRSRAHRPIEHLSAEEIRQREPALAGDVAGGVFYPADAQVDPVRLTRAVATAAERAGVVIRENAPVHHLVRGGDRVTVVHTGTERYHPGLVVVTAGAWSGQLGETLSLHIPTRPVKGQMLVAECRVAPVQTPVHMGEALLIPRNDGTLLLGVTVEEAGFDERVTLAGARRILDHACAVVPAISDLTLRRGWAGLRPATPDELPLMGPLPPLRNLWISTGHFRKGILLAPLSARLMTQSILADHLVDDLEPFKPSRHISS